MIDFRSPEISPPPSGFELPQAAVTRTNIAAKSARHLLLVFGIAIDIPNVLSPQAPPDTIGQVVSFAARKGKDEPMTSEPPVSPDRPIGGSPARGGPAPPPLPAHPDKETPAATSAPPRE